jgi:hypothetical protein
LGVWSFPRDQPLGDAKHQLRVIGVFPDLPVGAGEFFHGLREQDVVDSAVGFGDVLRGFGFDDRADHVADGCAEEAAMEFVLE